jgi:hypothetical protein
MHQPKIFEFIQTFFSDININATQLDKLNILSIGINNYFHKI